MKDDSKNAVVGLRKEDCRCDSGWTIEADPLVGHLSATPRRQDMGRELDRKVGNKRCPYCVCGSTTCISHLIAQR